METVFSYRGRALDREQIGFIRELIAQHPGASRRALSKRLCEAWDWRQANGGLRDMVCRSMMLQLHRAGHIELPARKFSPPNPLAKRSKPATDIVHDQNPMVGGLKGLQPLEIRQIRRTAQEAVFNGLIEAHHYLGYSQPVGEHLKYMVFSRGRAVACLGWSSAPRHIGARDRFIGWSAPVRRRNLHLLAYNTRFLILPWVRVRHLASHILGQVAQRISADWQEVYAHPVWYLETFVDRSRYRGTCYRAANWRYLGQTTGRGKDDNTGRANRTLKDVLGYALSKDFRDRLCEVSA
jgi:hypothetical protein